MYRAVATAVLAGAWALAGAAEPATGPDLKEAIGSLHAAAAKANDIWTCLQLERYAAEELRLRPGSILGGGTVYGDPRLAYPHDIRRIWDRGRSVDVVAGSRFYRLTPDGRPLQTAIRSPVWTGDTWLNQDGTRLVAANIWGNWDDRHYAVAAMDAVTGTVGISLEERLPAAPEDIYDRLASPVCSYDGSAVALVIWRYGKEPANRRLKLLVAGRDPVTRPDVARVWAVGNGGAWLILETHTRRDQPVLRTAEGDLPLPRRNGMARGPGLYCLEVEEDRRLELLAADGTRTAFEPAIGLGRGAEVHTVGDYLVVCSGNDARTRATLDILGRSVGGGQDQPYTMALYRWPDLVADQRAEPTLLLEHRFDPDRHGPPGLLLWNGAQLERLDLSGDAPVRSPLASLPWDIDWVETPLYHYFVRSRDRRERILLRADGQELWRGPEPARVKVLTRRHLLVGEGREEGSRQHVDTVATDPADRRRVTLELPVVPGYRISCDERSGRIVASHREGHWRLMDPETGRITERYDHQNQQDPRKPAPRTHRSSCPGGRWYDRGGRLLPKDGSWDDDPGRSLRPVNIFKGGSTVLILDAEGRLFHGRRPEDLALLARCRADGFGTLRDSKGFYLVRDRKVVAEVVHGPRLDTRTGARGKSAQGLDGGRWREQGRRHAWAFTPPGLGRWTWDEDLAGFSPHRCRSYPSTGLFVLTESVILELELGAIRRVAAKD